MGVENKREQRLNFLTNIAYWVVILAIVFLIFKYLINLVMPFFLAFIFAAVVRPGCSAVRSAIKKCPTGKRFL